MLVDFHRSGLTHVEFCQLGRISIHSFSNWLYRLRPVEDYIACPGMWRVVS
jgi:hypothetical protein